MSKCTARASSRASEMRTGQREQPARRRRKTPHFEVATQNHHRHVDAVEYVVQIRVQPQQIGVAAVQLVVVDRQLFVAGLDFFFRRLEFFVRALEFFVRRLNFLAGGLQFLVCSLLLFDYALQVLSRCREFANEVCAFSIGQRLGSLVLDRAVCVGGCRVAFEQNEETAGAVGNGYHFDGNFG